MTKLLETLIRRAREQGEREIKLTLEEAEQIEAELTRRPVRGNSEFRATDARTDGK
jgi:hypothetical protein